MPLTKRVTLDKAQPLPRPQFPHCTVRPFPQPQPRLCTRLPPPDLHTALGIAQRNTGDAHTHTHRPSHRLTRVSAGPCSLGHTRSHKRTHNHTHTRLHFDPAGSSHPPTPPPTPRSGPPHPALTLAHGTHTRSHSCSLTHTPPKSAVHQLLARAGLGAGGKKAHDSAGEEGCGGAQAREMTARGPPRVPAHEY